MELEELLANDPDLIATKKRRSLFSIFFGTNVLAGLILVAAWKYGKGFDIKTLGAILESTIILVLFLVAFLLNKR